MGTVHIAGITVDKPFATNDKDDAVEIRHGAKQIMSRLFNVLLHQFRSRAQDVVTTVGLEGGPTDSGILFEETVRKRPGGEHDVDVQPMRRRTVRDLFELALAIRDSLIQLGNASSGKSGSPCQMVT